MTADAMVATRAGVLVVVRVGQWEDLWVGGMADTTAGWKEQHTWDERKAETKAVQWVA